MKSFVEEDLLKDEEESLLFECPPIPLCGDIKMEFYEKETFGSDQKLFAFWFNTSFALVETAIQSFTLEVPKEGLDKAHKDKACKIFKETFKVICNFQPLASDKTIPSHELGDLTLEETKELSNLAGTASLEKFEKGPQSAALTPLTDKYPSLKNL